MAAAGGEAPFHSLVNAILRQLQRRALDMRRCEEGKCREVGNHHQPALPLAKW